MSSSPSQPDPSSSSQENQATLGPSAQEQGKLKELEPMMDFVVGGHVVRDALPSPVLPRELNPRCVDCGHPNNLPLVWFGVRFDQDKVLRYAISRGYGVRNEPGVGYHDLKTWANLVEKYYEKFRLYLQLREVWGYNMHILCFYANRDLPQLTLKHRKRAVGTILAMRYEKEDIHWWLDLDEEV